MPDSGEELLKVVDREAKDEAERRESRVLYEALRTRKDQIGAVNQIPARDEKLSEQILNQARSRSAEISAARQRSGSQAVEAASKPIPWWLWLAWLVAIIGAIAAFKIIS
jgi:hypothetical protein